MMSKFGIVEVRLSGKNYAVYKLMASIFVGDKDGGGKSFFVSSQSYSG
jgi:hypothetical protein